MSPLQEPTVVLGDHLTLLARLWPVDSPPRRIIPHLCHVILFPQESYFPLIKQY
uniref:Uncharacterized protein n=1 Tax=Arundo donax TaxID=35708 RepID=A0A0A8YAF2_ARUDO